MSHKCKKVKFGDRTLKVHPLPASRKKLRLAYALTVDQAVAILNAIHCDEDPVLVRNRKAVDFFECETTAAEISHQVDGDRLASRVPVAFYGGNGKLYQGCLLAMVKDRLLYR